VESAGYADSIRLRTALRSPMFPLYAMRRARASLYRDAAAEIACVFVTRVMCTFARLRALETVTVLRETP